MTGIPHSAGPDGGCNTFQVSSGTITITGTGTALDGTWPLVADYISTFSIISINSFDPVNGPLSWDLTNLRFDIGDGADHFVALPNLPGDCMGIGPLVAYTDSNSAFTNITGSITVIDPVDCSEEDYYPP
jgi:hypothetical protein